MPRITKWTAIAALISAITLLLGACTDDTNDEQDPQVSCERIQVDQTEYCVYEQPITETGYDCPSDLMNPIPFEDHTVCSGADQLPTEHEEPIREHFTEPEQGDPPTLAELCADPQAHDGRSVEFDGDLIDVMHGSSQMECSDEEPCCGSARVAYYLPCESSPGLAGVIEGIVLIPQGPEPSTIGCGGNQCAVECVPVRAEQMASFQGTFRSSAGSYNFEWDNQSALGAGMAVEVSEIDLVECCSGDITEQDSDGDCIPNTTDNCAEVANHAQADQDLDGVGDTCDNCPSTVNPSQNDQDLDGIGDTCDQNTCEAQDDPCSCPARDNDCDGMLNEDCSDPDFVCDECSLEVCGDSLDNDCDGVIDNGCCSQ